MRPRFRPETAAAIITAVVLVIPIGVARSWWAGRRVETATTIKALPLDLSYGAKIPEDASAKEVVEALLGESIDEFVFPDVEFPTTNPVPKSNEPCPPPGQDVFPERPLGVDAERAPVAGRYRYQQSGTLQVVGLGTFPLSGFTFRDVTDVVATSDGFSYSISGSIGLRQSVTRFDVVKGDGIFLNSVQTVTSEGSVTSNPISPVDVFNYPASNGAVTGLGLDPSAREVIQVAGSVSGTDRVEGCEENADAWRFEGTWTFTSPTASRNRVFDYKYWVAPQHGSMFIADHLKTQETVGPFTFIVDVKSTFASLEPVQ